jgi:hypothetical protein
MMWKETQACALLPTSFAVGHFSIPKILFMKLWLRNTYSRMYRENLNVTTVNSSVSWEHRENVPISNNQ